MKFTDQRWMNRVCVGMLGLALCAVTTSVPAQQSPTSPQQRGPSVEGVQSGSVSARESARTRRATGRPTDTRRGGGGGFSTGEPAEVMPRVGGAQESFEPVLLRDVEYGPAPQVAEDVRISLTGPMSARAFFDALAIATGWNIVASEAANQLSLEFWSNEMTPAQALAILRYNDIYYEYDEETTFLRAMTVEEYLRDTYGLLAEQTFTVRHIDIAGVETVLQSMLSPVGRFIADPSSSSVIVYDTVDNLEFLETVVRRLDAPQQSRSFHLVHVDAEAILDSVEALMTEGGRMNTDPRTNTLLVFDRPERLDQIEDLVTMLDRELETRSWKIDFADPVIIADYVAELIPPEMGSIVVNEGIHQITVTATPFRLDEIDARIASWDEQRRQVQIEAYLATVSRNIIRDLGINWEYATTWNGDPISVAVGSIASAGGGGDGDGGDGTPNLSGVTINRQGGNLNAVITALDTSNDATILAHPRITVQDGEEATFENTTQVPFATSTTTFGNVNNTVNSNTQIDFIDVGTILRVTPRITSFDTISMTIDAEDSTFVEVEIFANGEINTLPQKTQNRAQTQVSVNDRETIVLGGLRTSNNINTADRVPILADIPLIGRAFRSTGKAHSDRELLIFLTPTIVGGTTVPETERLAAFDEELSQTMREDAKTYFERWRSKIEQGEDEYWVAIGQTGSIYAEGELITLNGLETELRGLSTPENKKLILREHPRAPRGVGASVTEVAMEVGLEVVLEQQRSPYVPRVESSDALTADAESN